MDLVPRHAVQQHGHGERGHLRVRDVPPGVGVDHPAQGVLGDLSAVALDADDVHGVVGSTASTAHRGLFQVSRAERVGQDLIDRADP